MKYYIKVTCALKWARKLPRKTETYESAKCVPRNTRKYTRNGFVSDLLKWALKCRFMQLGPGPGCIKRPYAALRRERNHCEQPFRSLINLQRDEKLDLLHFWPVSKVKSNMVVGFDFTLIWRASKMPPNI